MTHQLRFTRPVPKAIKDADGYLLRWQGTAVMGVLNVTPDSFSDGGRYLATDSACRQARTLLEAGALILDVGGESTRPGAEPVSAERELDRVLPVLRCLRETDALVSIDTYKPEVAAEALRAGAHMVNDVSGFRDPEMARVCVEAGAPAVLMHMQGTPQTMQANPSYEDVCEEVFSFLRNVAARALQAGVPSVMVDPGIGFGKTLEHNLALLRNLDRLTALGYPVLLGASRKGLIKQLTGEPDAAARDPGSLAAHLYGAQQGVAMVRAHDVRAHVQALKVWWAIHG